MVDTNPRYESWGDPKDELFSGAKAWGSDGPWRAVDAEETTLAANDDGDTFNDAKLSHTQPWRSRYPTPRDLKERLAKSSSSYDRIQDTAFWWEV